MKTSLTSINWVSAPLWGTWWIGPRTREKMTITPVRKECMSCCFLVKSQKQKTLGSTAVMCCFLMCDSYLQTRWRKITNRPSLEYRKSISLPLKNMSGNYIAQWWSTGTRQQDTGYPVWERKFTRRDKSKGSADSYLAKTLCRLSLKWR